MITPYKINNIRLLFLQTPKLFQNSVKKLFVKQSYLMLTWFWYIQSQKTLSNTCKPSFVFKPSKKKKITILKAPMAHKTFSQEQLQFQFFPLVISFKIVLGTGGAWLNLNTLDKSLVLILQLRRVAPFIETNFFLLQRLKLHFYLSDMKFLKII